MLTVCSQATINTNSDKPSQKRLVILIIWTNHEESNRVQCDNNNTGTCTNDGIAGRGDQDPSYEGIQKELSLEENVPL